MFHVGQFVVCVDDAPTAPFDPVVGDRKWRSPDGLGGLKKGKIYTVRLALASDVRSGRPSVYLSEIVRKPDRWGEPPFRVERFRPLKDSSLSVFRQALSPAPRETETA